jgi:hypothetical protein
VIENEFGGIYVDLGEVIANAALLQAVKTREVAGEVNLVFMPMPSGRTAVSVIKT